MNTRSPAQLTFLGIDLGTSAVKALLVTQDGRVLGQGMAGYPIHRPQPNRAEQEPETWWQAVVQAVHQATSDTPPPAAIGLSGQMHGTVLLDAARRPLMPAVIWPDRRSVAEVEQLTQTIGLDNLMTQLGSRLATGFQAATLAWIRQARPEIWRAIRHILLPKDYLRLRLTGDLATDPSDAAGALLFNGATRTWDETMLAALALDPSWLPPVQPSHARAGTLQPAAAAAFGLPEGLPVVTGAADTACSALGAGLTSPGALLLTLSSGGQLLTPIAQFTPDPQGRIHTFCSALPPEQGPGWYQLGALLNVGLALNWLREQVLRPGSPDDAGAYRHIMQQAAEAPPGAQGLLFLPYLSGERTPHMDPAARGALIGLTNSHGPAALARAVLEGISMACYDAYSVLHELGARPEQLILAGGGAANPFWRQLIADLFGLPAARLAVEEQSALGAAILAGAGVAGMDLVATSRTWTKTEPPLQPNPARHAEYQSLLPLFRTAYRQNRDLMASLQHVTQTG